MKNLLSIAGKRIRHFRRDERGNVVLLSGVMVFMIAIFTVATIDASVMIRHRIIAQNAADTAADSAALWQARGLNLVQHLNNLHRLINKIATGIQSVGCIGCTASPALLVASKIPLTAAVGEPAYQAACVACIACPWVDVVQEYVAKGINIIQKGINYSFPIVAFLRANTNAKASEADPLLSAFPLYVANGVEGLLPDYIGGAVPNNLDANTISAKIIQALSGVPIYAYPLNAKQVLLSLKEKKGKKYPWKTPKGVAKAWQVAAQVGRVACGASASGTAINKGMIKMQGKDWGYQSKFYWGNPGFLTWIAGKSMLNEDDKYYGVGLRDAIWLNSDQATVDPEDINLWYTGSALAPDEGHIVSPVLGIASAHVEGSVVRSGKVKPPDAVGHLIPVQKPNGNKASGNEMHYLLIYH